MERVEIEVRERAIVSIVRVASGEAVEGSDRDLYRTIARLLDFVQEALDRDADIIAAEFNPSFGYPVDVLVDYEQSATDEEMAFLIHDFETLGSPATTPAPKPTVPPTRPGLATQAARDALAVWLGPVGDPMSISVRTVEAVTWRNGCLELTRAGQACTQALVEGYRIELTLGEATYEVRTNASGSVVLWAPRIHVLARFVEASPNLAQFMSDDGGTIEVQIVFGSDLGVDLASLTEGDPVGLALADAPQGGGFLLVWLVPLED